MAGAAAGLCQSFVCSPIELAKLRAQISDQGSKGPIECLKSIYTTEGIKGVFRGFGLTVGREVPSFGAYFVTYEFLTRTEEDTPVSTWAMLFAGGCAGKDSLAVFRKKKIATNTHIIEAQLFGTHLLDRRNTFMSILDECPKIISFFGWN